MIVDFYSIVIPTMWCSDKLFDMLPIYNASDYVKEIIIIDNNPSKKGNIDFYDKVRYNYYLINHDVIVNICKKFNIIEDNLIFDYYYNIVIPFLNNQYILIDDNKDF